MRRRVRPSVSLWIVGMAVTSTRGADFVCASVRMCVYMFKVKLCTHILKNGDKTNQAKQIRGVATQVKRR